jgi:CRISPR-associated protein Cas2
MYYLVCFDIVDNRVRYRLVKILKKYGIRVQKSVFECAGLTEKQFLRMQDRIDRCIDATQDSVYYYFISLDCLKRMEFSGIGKPPNISKFNVV